MAITSAPVSFSSVVLPSFTRETEAYRLVYMRSYRNGSRAYVVFHALRPALSSHRSSESSDIGALLKGEDSDGMCDRLPSAEAKVVLRSDLR